MSKQRYVETSFWSDEYVVDRDITERYYFLYLLTNEHTNICGIYKLAVKVMCRETGLDQDQIKLLQARLQSDRKAVFVDGWVVLVNFLNHQKMSGKVLIGAKNQIKLVPPEILKKAIEYGYPIDTLSIGYEGSSRPMKELDRYEPESESELKSESKGTPAGVHEFIKFFSETSEAIQKVKPEINGGQDGSLVKTKLKKYDFLRLQKMVVWYLSDRKKVQNSRNSEWEWKWKNSPSISTMLSSSFFNELLTEEKNNPEFERRWSDLAPKLLARGEKFQELQLMKTRAVKSMPGAQK